MLAHKHIRIGNLSDVWWQWIPPDHAEDRPTAYRCGGPSELRGRARKFQHALEFRGPRPQTHMQDPVESTHTGHGCQCWRSSMSGWCLQEARHQQDMLDARIGNLSDMWWQPEDQPTAYRCGMTATKWQDGPYKKHLSLLVSSQFPS